MVKNTGSIRENFEEFDNDDDEIYERAFSPGPGNHLKHFHINMFGQSHMIQNYPQNFGVMDRKRD